MDPEIQSELHRIEQVMSARFDASDKAVAAAFAASEKAIDKVASQKAAAIGITVAIILGILGLVAQFAGRP